MAYSSVFFTIVYPQALPYFKDVCHSAMLQTRRDFDFIVVNDGCNTATLRKHLAGLNATILDAAGTPAQNRQQGINYARKQNYKYIFFCDADDTFSANRYERTIIEFKKSKAHDRTRKVCGQTLPENPLSFHQMLPSSHH